MEKTNRKRNKILERARLRRKHAHQIIMLRFISAMLIAMTVATFSLSIRSFAGERDFDKPSYKYYTSYTVSEGENLSSLAEEFMTDEYRTVDEYIAEVASINHIASVSDIYAGQKIILPYFSKEVK